MLQRSIIFAAVLFILLSSGYMTSIITAPPVKKETHTVEVPKTKPLSYHKYLAFKEGPKIMAVTTYSLHPSECGKHHSHPEYGMTASSTQAEVGRTVAAIPSIPFGAKVFIDHPYFKELNDGKWYTVEDRGAGVTGIDVYLGDPQKNPATRSKVQKFGLKRMPVYIINPEEK